MSNNLSKILGGVLIKIPSSNRPETVKKLTKYGWISHLRNVIKLEKSFKLCHKHVLQSILGYFHFIVKNSVQSSFLFFCKYLIHVVFAVANNSAVSIRLSIVSNQNWFFFSIMSCSSRLQDSRLYFSVIYEVI